MKKKLEVVIMKKITQWDAEYQSPNIVLRLIILTAYLICVRITVSIYGCYIKFELHEPCSNPKHKAQASSSCLPKESQPRKNAYDIFFPLLFTFKFKVKFDRVKKKKKVATYVFGGKKGEKKNLPASSVFFFSSKNGLRS